jgi:hypothetical protein
MATTTKKKRPGKLRRKLYKVLWDGAAQIAKDREARKKAQGARMIGGGQSSSSGQGSPPRRRPSGWTRPNNGSPGAAIPPMPADYTATGWDGRPVTDPAGLRFFWARENGYSGPIDQDGNPADAWDDDRSSELEWADTDGQDVEQGAAQGGESR